MVEQQPPNQETAAPEHVEVVGKRPLAAAPLLTDEKEKVELSEGRR